MITKSFKQRALERKTHLEGLSDDSPELVKTSGYVNFIIQCDNQEHQIADVENLPLQVLPAVVTLEDTGINWIGPLQLEDHLYLWSGRCNWQVLRDLLSRPDFVEAYLAETWDELWTSDHAHPHRDVAFSAMVNRSTLKQNDLLLRVPLTKLLPGDEVVEIHPTLSVFWTEDCVVGPLPVLDWVKEKVEIPPSWRSFQFSEAPEHFAYVFVYDFAVTLTSEVPENLGQGVTWWPSRCFPHQTEVLEALKRMPRGTFLSDGTEYEEMFTGVLLIPLAMPALKRDHLPDVLRELNSKMGRLRLALNTIFARSFFTMGIALFRREASDKPLMLDAYHPANLFEFSSQQKPLVSLADVALLKEALEVTFMEPSKKTLPQYIQKSLDALYMALTINDRSMSHVLLWASVEALLSDDDEKSGMTMNLALSLAGLHDLSRQGTAFATFKQAKDSYGARSRIVHSYSPPERKKLDQWYEFTERSSHLLIHHAYQHHRKALRSESTEDDIKFESSRSNLNRILQRHIFIS